MASKHGTTRRAGLDLWTGRARRLDPDQAIEVVEHDSPVVLSVPHAGTWIPPEALGFVRATRSLLVDTDLATDVLYPAALPNASRIVTRVSPYVVNVNRAPRDPAKPVLPPRHLYGEPTHSRLPTAAEQRLLRARYYTTYHRLLRQLLARARKQFGYALLLDGHSLNSVGGPFTKDPGEPRASFVVGDRNGTSAAPAVSQRFTETLGLLGRPQHWTVVRNKPYQGGWITRSNGDPAHGTHVLQLETHKALYLHGEAYDAAHATPSQLRLDPRRLALVAHAIGRATEAARRVLA